MAACRAGMKTVIVPIENEPDLKDIDPIVLENIEFVTAETMQTVLQTALCDAQPAAELAIPVQNPLSLTELNVPTQSTLEQ